MVEKTEEYYEQERKRQATYREKNREWVRERGKKSDAKRKNKRKTYYQENKERLTEYYRQYRQKHREKISERRKEWNRQAREQCIIAYGGWKCACCGETIQQFLTIDHINNDGNEHRKEIGNHLYGWLINNAFPKGFQVLCMNCNFGKRLNGGICPHQSSSKS